MVVFGVLTEDRSEVKKFIKESKERFKYNPYFEGEINSYKVKEGLLIIIYLKAFLVNFLVSKRFTFFIFKLAIRRVGYTQRITYLTPSKALARRL